MCRTVHALLSTIICGIQMLVRVFMTIILMVENLIRMILQTLYNFISFMLQMFSLIPICVVFLVTARLKCFMCGGGGPCPVNRGGACDCLMSAAALIILFFIFRATGVLDKIFYKIGYVQAPPIALVRFVPTPGEVTECSRNDTESIEPTTSPMTTSTNPGHNLLRYLDYTTETETEIEETEATEITIRYTAALKSISTFPFAKRRSGLPKNQKFDMTTTLAPYSTINPVTIPPISENPQDEKMKITFPPLEDSETDNINTITSNLTTVLYYLV